MIYVDSSVVLAEVLGEPVRPHGSFWDEDLVASRLLEYEVWNRVHAYGAAAAGAHVRRALGVIALIDLTPEILVRALDPFPVATRTLDALHLASAWHLQAETPDLRLASYDHRMNDAATALGFPLADLP